MSVRNESITTEECEELRGQVLEADEVASDVSAAVWLSEWLCRS